MNTSVVLGLVVCTLALIGALRVYVVSYRAITRGARALVPRTAQNRARARLAQLRCLNEQRVNERTYL